MAIKYIFLFSVAIFPLNKSHSQSIGKITTFTLNGETPGKDTGSVILWYCDENNQGVADTLNLSNGKFHCSGTVNRVCEAILWTDSSNHDYDDPSVVRLLLEPANINISYRVNDPLKPVIKGSQSEMEKEKWDNQKSFLLILRAQIRKAYDSLNKLANNSANSAFKDQMKGLARKSDSIYKEIMAMDIGYIKRHPNSYLSAYLLSKYTRRLSVDSIQHYFEGLAIDTKKSNLGHQVLMNLYSLTDDKEFRKANPLVDAELDQRLSKMNSVYDLSLQDTLGNTIELSSLKRKFLVIDFWASWCRPCIENIPALSRIMELYKADSIQFVSISLDKDVDKWKESIKNHHFRGIQLSDPSGFASLAALYCKVIWVPKYIVADQNGRIINYDAPQAVDPALKTYLDNLLK